MEAKKQRETRRWNRNHTAHECGRSSRANSYSDIASGRAKSLRTAGSTSQTNWDFLERIAGMCRKGTLFGPQPLPSIFYRCPLGILLRLDHQLCGQQSLILVLRQVRAI